MSTIGETLSYKYVPHFLNYLVKSYGKPRMGSASKSSVRGILKVHVLICLPWKCYSVWII